MTNEPTYKNQYNLSLDRRAASIDNIRRYYAGKYNIDYVEEKDVALREKIDQEDKIDYFLKFNDIETKKSILYSVQERNRNMFAIIFDDLTFRYKGKYTGNNREWEKIIADLFIYNVYSNTNILIRYALAIVPYIKKLFADNLLKINPDISENKIIKGVLNVHVKENRGEHDSTFLPININLLYDILPLNTFNKVIRMHYGWNFSNK